VEKYESHSQCSHRVFGIDTTEEVSTLVVATAHDSLMEGAAAIVHIWLVMSRDGARVGEGHVLLGLALPALRQ
jgi:hypothetical protein